MVFAKIQEKQWAQLLLLLFFSFYTILAFFSEGTYGGADDISHYKFSRYSFEYPELLLDHWAKPFYTLVMAPFAQFGFIGVRVFNVFLGCLTAYFSYLTAVRLSFKNSIFVIVFLLLSTLYPALMLSGMTEILFSFLLILSIYLFLKKRYIFSAIVISFLPLVRTEGIVVLLLFILPSILKKKYLLIGFLFTGFLIYSIIGGLYFDDFFWLITQMPYGDATDIYGTGSIFHFIKHSKNIFGIVLSFLIIGGLLLSSYYFFNKKTSTHFKNNETTVLVILPAITYYAAHSFSWYLGIGASAGLLRVIAGVIPLFAIIALITFDFILEKFKMSLFLRTIFALLITGLLIHSCFSFNKFPVPLREKNQLVKEASEWIKNSEFNNRKVYYYDPYFYFFLDRNPYDKKAIQERIPDPNEPGNKMEKGEMLVWDAHFGPNEGRLSIENIEKSPLLKKIKTFKPKNNFTVLGGHKYRIVLFEKIVDWKRR